jgi:predicted permease
MQTLLSDLRFAIRQIRMSPGFTFVAVLTLALGIAANTTVFGWMKTIVLNPFPGAADPHQLAMLETSATDGQFLRNVSFLDYLDYRDNMKQAAGVAVSRFTPLYAGPEGRSERIFAELVSLNFFDVLGVVVEHGPGIRPAACEETPESCPLVVLSHRYWHSRFGGDPSVAGRKLLLNRREFTIAGVAPDVFRGGMNGLSFDVWVPLNWAGALGTGGGTLNFRGTRDLTSTFIRLKPGVTVDQAAAEAASIAAQLAGAHPATNRGITVTLSPLHQAQSGAQQLLAKPLRMLMAVAFILLLIVCANVCNLLLARGVSRRKEFGVRLAMGAGGGRLARQLLTEALLLALLGSAAGVLLSLWMSDALRMLMPRTDLPLAFGTPLDLATLAWCLLLSIVVTVITGLAPALLAVRASLNDTLKESSRGADTSGHSHRLRGLLVVSEVALAAVALIGAGLFMKSFHSASGIEPGFDTANIMTGKFYLSAAGYSGAEQREFCVRLRRTLESQPGVAGVSYGDSVPLDFGPSPWHQVDIDGYTPAPAEQMIVHRSLVPPGYFDLLRIPILEGRDFNEADISSAPRVVLVNQTFARRYLSGGMPVGRKIRVERNEHTVIGVVRDAKYHSPAEAAMPYFYFPFAQRFAPGLNFSFFVKTQGDPGPATAALRREARTLNPDAAVYNLMPLGEATSSALYPQKTAASLISALGAAALLLAAIGLFSVMSYTVSQRTREMGIRMALGARPSDVLGIVVRHGLGMVAPGLLIGAALAVYSSHWAQPLLVGVRPGEPVIYASAILFLAAIAAVACLAPAVRVARIDPISVLRQD